jgi:flagellar hook assembly protein FlgD
MRYTIQESGQVRIAVYNLMGQKVATLVDGMKQAGAHTVRWNAAGQASGMYYYRLEANGQVITKKMTLIK